MRDTRPRKRSREVRNSARQLQRRQPARLPAADRDSAKPPYALPALSRTSTSKPRLPRPSLHQSTITVLNQALRLVVDGINNSLSDKPVIPRKNHFCAPRNTNPRPRTLAPFNRKPAAALLGSGVEPGVAEEGPSYVIQSFPARPHSLAPDCRDSDAQHHRARYRVGCACPRPECVRCKRPD